MSLSIYEVHKDLIDGLAVLRRDLNEIAEAERTCRAELGKIRADLRGLEEDLEELRVEVARLKAQQGA